MGIGSIAIAMALATAHTRTHADEPPPTEVVVSGGAAQVELATHPKLITSVFMPDPIDNVLASDKENFTVRRMGNAVAIRPKRVDTTLRASVTIVSKTLRITVLVSVVERPGDAQGQLTIRKAEVERELQERIDREVEQRLAAARAQMGDEIEAAIAVRVFRRQEEHRLGAVDRNGNVILRVLRLLRVGDHAYLRFSIQNRTRSTYRLHRVRVVAGADAIGGQVVFAGALAQGAVLGTVAPAATREALVVVRDADQVAGGTITLEIAEAEGQRAVRVGGVRVR